MARLSYLDGLRGLLCLIVIHHHGLCGFDPCKVFGPNPSWIVDPSICDSSTADVVAIAGSEAMTGTSFWSQQLWQILTSPFSNGPFAVATFFVMSGCALSLNLFHADDDKWRLAVTKRFFRLALPCGAAMIFTYMHGGFDYHLRAADITQSKWLIDVGIRRPLKSPFLGMLYESFIGIWHNTSTLNNAVWTMTLELLGSYLVFLVVAVLKGVPSSRRRQQILLVMIMALHWPSPCVRKEVAIRLEFKSKLDPLINGTVVVNPMSHFHLVQVLEEKQMLRNMTYTEIELKTWTLQGLLTQESHDKKEEEQNEKELPIDSPKLQKLVHGSLASKIISTDEISVQDAQIFQKTSWSTSKPYAWYSAFLAGVLIAERIRVGSRQKVLHDNPMDSTRNLALVSILIYLCASFPFKFGSLIADQNIIWSIMGTIASFFNLDAAILYHTLGATMLVYLIVFGPDIIKRLLSTRYLLYLGRISFVLYLTHIPIMYTLTSALYVYFKEQQTLVAVPMYMALAVSTPYIFGVATVFEKYVDEPSIRWSGVIGRTILGSEQQGLASYSGLEQPSFGCTTADRRTETMDDEAVVANIETTSYKRKN